MSYEPYATPEYYTDTYGGTPGSTGCTLYSIEQLRSAREKHRTNCSGQRSRQYAGKIYSDQASRRKGRIHNSALLRCVLHDATHSM